MVEVQLFDLGADEPVIAFLGVMGGAGVLIWRGAQAWEFHEPGSLAWDSQHQSTYRNSRGTLIDAQALAARGAGACRAGAARRHAPRQRRGADLDLLAHGDLS